MVDSPFDVELKVSEVIDAEPFPEAEKPKMTKLWIGADRRIQIRRADRRRPQRGGYPVLVSPDGDVPLGGTLY